MTRIISAFISAFVACWRAWLVEDRRLINQRKFRYG
jgi:hypothetical protein